MTPIRTSAVTVDDGGTRAAQATHAAARARRPLDVRIRPPRKGGTASSGAHVDDRVGAVGAPSRRVGLQVRQPIRAHADGDVGLEGP